MKLRNQILIIIATSMIALLVISAMSLYSLRKTMLADRTTQIANLLDVARNLVKHYRQMETSGQLSSELAQAKAKEMLAAMRRDDGYIFVRSITDDITLVHPNPTVIGRVNRTLKTRDGRIAVDVYLELLSKADKAYVEIYNYKPSMPQSRLLPELIGVTRFEPWQWMIGTGFYVDDIDAAYWRGVGLFLLVSGVLITIVAGLAFVMWRRILGQLGGEPRYAQEVAAAIAGGDFSRPIQVQGSNDTLLGAMRQMQESLRDMTGKIGSQVKQLTLQKEVAESATLAKSRFLAAASHDLRQPMHALNLYLGAFAGYDLPAPARPLLSNMRLCAQTMDEMFCELLDISRLDASVVQVNIDVFPIASLLERIGMEFAPQAQSKGLDLRVAPCSAWVRSDPALLERILRNLVANAVRYTEHGKILVGCRRTSGGVRLAVYDTGPGIAPAHQRAVFEEFYQVGNPGRDRAQGLGLGLAIVQRLAQLLDAKVSLSSEVGCGSVFSIELLVVQTVEQAVGQADADKKLAPAGNTINFSDALIVVVDDEPSILDATRALLEQWGCKVVTAASAGEAIERLSHSPRVPDAVICDYRLQAGESGIQVIESIGSEFNRNIPALLITGDTGPQHIKEIQASGLVVLHKPLQEDALREALARLIASAETV